MPTRAAPIHQLLREPHSRRRAAKQVIVRGEAAPDGGIYIPIRLTQGDIADLVGASRKRVNQAMVFFKEQGLIDTDAEGRISIYDRDGLARYCS